MVKSKTFKIAFIAPLACLTIGVLNSCRKEAADLVVFCNVYTAENENDSLAEAFAVKNRKYIYVGSKEGAKGYINNGKTQKYH